MNCIEREGWKKRLNEFNRKRGVKKNEVKRKIY